MTGAVRPSLHQRDFQRDLGIVDQVQVIATKPRRAGPVRWPAPRPGTTSHRSRTRRIARVEDTAAETSTPRRPTSSDSTTWRLRRRERPRRRRHRHHRPLIFDPEVAFDPPATTEALVHGALPAQAGLRAAAHLIVSLLGTDKLADDQRPFMTTTDQGIRVQYNIGPGEIGTSSSPAAKAQVGEKVVDRSGNVEVGPQVLRRFSPRHGRPNQAALYDIDSRSSPHGDPVADGPARCSDATARIPHDEARQSLSSVGRPRHGPMPQAEHQPGPPFACLIARCAPGEPVRGWLDTITASISSSAMAPTPPTATHSSRPAAQTARPTRSPRRRPARTLEPTWPTPSSANSTKPDRHGLKIARPKPSNAAHAEVRHRHPRRRPQTHAVEIQVAEHRQAADGMRLRARGDRRAHVEISAYDASRSSTRLVYHYHPHDPPRPVRASQLYSHIDTARRHHRHPRPYDTPIHHALRPRRGPQRLDRRQLPQPASSPTRSRSAARSRSSTPGVSKSYDFVRRDQPAHRHGDWNSVCRTAAPEGCAPGNARRHLRQDRHNLRHRPSMDYKFRNFKAPFTSRSHVNVPRRYEARPRAEPGPRYSSPDASTARTARSAPSGFPPRCCRASACRLTATTKTDDDRSAPRRSSPADVVGRAVSSDVHGCGAACRHQSVAVSLLRPLSPLDDLPHVLLAATGRRRRQRPAPRSRLVDAAVEGGSSFG